MSLERFIEYCEKNSREETRDKNPKHRRFINDIIKNPGITGLYKIKRSFPNVVLYEKGRFGGKIEKGVIDVVMVDNKREVYVCMAKVCNRAGRRVRKRLCYAEDYLRKNFRVYSRLVSARRYRGKVHSRVLDSKEDACLIE